ncbi:hypothetical protein JOY44_31025 (plasmid) [Phormidium sp. CLA17]|uniref:CAP domain-containing protein n=1 Tax=Leptolyngbya sp. Cla-17 TaxID=2803751 RepID=UPI001A41E3B1|nr:hypothetical protein [Leptolyngbya sp. Cla-17]MBM0745802.1 hypothetical protein [Leptolyngbya sp. Cla-17]
MPGLLIAGVSLLSAKMLFTLITGRVGRVGRLVNQKYRCSTLTAVDSPPRSSAVGVGAGEPRSSTQWLVAASGRSAALSIVSAAQQDMMSRNYYAHVTPEGRTPTDRFTQVGGRGGVGENIMQQTGGTGISLSYG